MRKEPKSKYEIVLHEQVSQIADIMQRQAEANRRQFGLRLPISTSTYQYVLALGYYMDIDTSPVKAADRMPARECYRNAAMTALQSERFLYCEGFAISNRVGLAVPHAWNYDTVKGKVRDFTVSWVGAGVAYLGVVFAPKYLTAYVFGQQRLGGIFGDHRDAYELLEVGLPTDAWYDAEELTKLYAGG